MGKEQGNTLCKEERIIHLHHVRATALSELFPLEDQDPRNDDAPPAEAVGEANVLWTRRLPYKPTLVTPRSHDQVRSRAEHEANWQVASGTEKTETDDR